MIDNKIRIAEVLYYAFLRAPNCDTVHPVAIVSLYGEPDMDLLKSSCHTYWTAQHLRETGICVLCIKDIISVVMMAPDTQYINKHPGASAHDRWFLMEKPGLKVFERVGVVEEVA
jgi:hypothetical protein